MMMTAVAAQNVFKYCCLSLVCKQKISQSLYLCTFPNSDQVKNQNKSSQTHNVSLITTVFKNHGFTSENITELIDNPVIMESNPEKLEKSLSAWLQCQLGQENIINLVLKAPHLLLIPGNQIISSYMNFSKLFSNKTIFKLFYNSPVIATEPFKVTEKKINYLENVMKISKTEIANKGGLDVDLNEIKVRHIFLERCGAFKPLGPKATPQERRLNPKLDKILYTSDKEFSEKVAKLSLFEFEVFRNLCEFEEIEDVSENDSDESE